MAINDPKAPGQTGPRKRQDASGNKVLDPNEELALIEKEILDLRILFEHYFLGMERTSPLRRRDALAERIRRLKASGVIRNTGLKFKLEQLASKFGTYERMWARTLAEIEAGTYRRDVFKMKHRQARAAEAPANAPPPAPSKAPPREPILSDGQMRALFDTYVMAKQRTNESTAGITYEALSATLRKQVPELLTKYDCKAIDFKVVIKGGKTLLKAVPRK